MLSGIIHTYKEEKPTLRGIQWRGKGGCRWRGSEMREMEDMKGHRLEAISGTLPTPGRVSMVGN